MSKRIITPVALLALFMAAAAQLINLADADAGLRDHFLNQTGCSQRCPACDHVCKLDAKQVEEEKTCFDVESKVICIPRVVFPWQKKKACGSCDSCAGQGCDSCTHNGARTRKICVLKTEKYKCPACKYTWSAEKKPCGTNCDSGCAAGCDAGCAAGCDVGCDATPYSTQPMIYRELASPGLESVEVAAPQGIEQNLPAPAGK